MSINKIAQRVLAKESSADPTGQGQWFFTTNRGKNNIKLHIVSLYKCCKPSSPGPSTVYMQQKRIDDAKRDERDSHDNVLKDLSIQLAEWEEQNNKIIISADMNDNINSDVI